MVAAVLIVDDDGDLRGSLRDFLEDDGVAACTIARGLAQVRELGQRALACSPAIVDINLGSRQPSGLDVAAWLRTSGFRGRIVFLTGHAKDHPLVKRAAQDQTARVLARPMNTNTLLSIVASAA